VPRVVAQAHSITYTANRLDELRRTTCRGHLAPQRLDVAVDRTVRDRKATAPDAIDELGACEHTFRGGHHLCEQIELHAGEFKRGIAVECAPGCAVRPQYGVGALLFVRRASK